MHRGAAATFGAAAAALFTILLLSLRHVEGVPTFVVVLLVALLSLSAWRPGAALMVVAASVPIAAWTGRWWNGTVAWPETLVVAFAAGYSARSLWSRRERPDDLDLPIYAFAALVIASLTVRLLVLYWTIGGAALWEQLSQLASADYFVASASFSDLDAAMRLIEGLVLLRAASSVAQSNAPFAPSVVRWFVAGATVAAALNLWRIWQGALRLEEPVATFIRYLTTLRYNVHYPDVNAAGSYFVMALLVAIGLTIATRQVVWVVTPVLIASSLVLSGSRAALLAGAVTALAWTTWRVKRAFQRPHSRSSAISLASLGAVVCVSVALFYVSALRNVTPSFAALQVRAGFAHTTLNMISAHPVFGIGIGQYPAQSNSYSPPLFVETIAGPNENAHNNFLQILGELGILGLCAFLWVIWRSVGQPLQWLAARPDPLCEGVVAGLVAFILSWLSGHPLLIDEPALSFWLLLGTATAWTTASPRGGEIGWARRALVTMGVVALGLSVPPRASHELANAELEHRAIGLSNWRIAPDGVRYRMGGQWSTVFVPSSARAVIIPLRSAEPGTDRIVQIDLNGRPADVVRVPADGWYHLNMALPVHRFDSRFMRLELRVEGERLPDAVLMIGKVEPR